MRLPIIKHLVANDALDAAKIETAVDVLIELSEARGIKDEEMDAIGELVSNCEGAIAVMEDNERCIERLHEARHWIYRCVIGL